MATKISRPRLILCLLFVSGLLSHCDMALAQHLRLWGTTYDGGDGAGVLFRYSYITDSLQVMHTFSPWGPRYPNSGVIYDSAAQKVYGTYSNGGLNIVSAGGVYSFSMIDSALNVIYDCRFSSGGTNPVAMPIQVSQNRIWGTDMYGGSNSYGTLYTVDLDSGKKTIRRNFSASNGAGYDPYQSPVFANGKMYGLTHGSTSSAAGLGVLYEFDTTTNVYTVKRQFTHPIGNQPQGRLLLHPNGKLYGTTTSAGANNYGTLFEYDPTTDSFIVRHDFQRSTTGSNCMGLLTLHPNGKIYGLASNGGVNGAGTIFEYDTGTKSVTKKIDLVDSIGSFPWGGLTLAANGKMYAVPHQGGANGLGTLMEYDLSTNTISRKVSFNGPNGSGPTWVVLQEAWTNDRPYLLAMTKQDSLCVGDTAHKVLLFATDGDGDTLQAIIHSSNPAVMPVSAFQIKYLGAGYYEAAYTPGSLPGDTGIVQIVLKLSDAYGGVTADNVIFDLYVRDCSPSTGLHAQASRNALLNVHPNPTSDFVQVSLPNDRTIESWRVLNAQGQTVQPRFVLHRSGMELDVSGLIPGLYYLRVETKSGEHFTETFLKQ